MRLNQSLDLILSIAQFAQLNFCPNPRLRIRRRDLLQSLHACLRRLDFRILSRGISRILDHVPSNRERDCRQRNVRLSNFSSLCSFTACSFLFHDSSKASAKLCISASRSRTSSWKSFALYGLPNVALSIALCRCLKMLSSFITDNPHVALPYTLNISVGRGVIKPQKVILCPDEPGQGKRLRAESSQQISIVRRPPSHNHGRELPQPWLYSPHSAAKQVYRKPALYPSLKSAPNKEAAP
jgi:hypothetical protein